MCVQLVFNQELWLHESRRIKKEVLYYFNLYFKNMKILLWIDRTLKMERSFRLYLCVLSKGCNILGLITVFIH